jgi:signal transduction histidine kinase
LDANRIRAGKAIPLEIEKCDLKVLADQVCAELKNTYGDRIQTRIPTHMEGYWSCKNLQRLLENLIINGIKYGYRDTQVTLTIQECNSHIQITVHNFGNPIPQDEQKHLFDSFMRSKTAESSPKKGWGLGLTLVRGVVEAHGGRVEVQSDPKKGTVFQVTLPKDARNLQNMESQRSSK